ncbi:MAG: TrbC/VirB2 family protein [Bdellovibrionota bacterium]
MKYGKYLIIFGLTIFLMALIPDAAHAAKDLVGGLTQLKLKLTNVILPLLSVIGIAIAAISFFTGNPNAKQHIVYAVLGCIFGFGAQSIVDFISQTVR